MKPDYAAQCRFFSAEDACRVALQAYYAATKHITPPPGEPWLDDSGAPYASGSDFAEAFAGELQARVGLLALDRLGEFYAVGWDWDALRLACEIAPEKISPLLAKREADKAALNAEFNTRDATEICAPENETFATPGDPIHNRETEVVAGG